MARSRDGYKLLNRDDSQGGTGRDSWAGLLSPRDRSDSRTLGPGRDERAVDTPQRREWMQGTATDRAHQGLPLDVVQFASDRFHAYEEEGVGVATVMRIGSLRETCTVDFKTENNAAVAGTDYAATTGTITFLPQEELKQIEIPLINTPFFDTNLDFKVVLENPQNCMQASDLNSGRIFIHDDDCFPNNRFREQIESEDLDNVGVRMLGDFIMFCIRRVPLVGWRSYWTLFLDQFQNVNYLLTIKLNIYLVDVVLNKDPEARQHLWVEGQPVWTAVLVALALLAPKILISIIEYLQVGELSVAGKVKLHLKVNLFRRYLYYDARSYSQVTPQDLVKTIGDDINDVVKHGFMVIFKVAQQFVQVGVILYFLCRKRPSSALPLLIYPVAMALVLNLRYFQTLRLQEKVRVAEVGILTHVTKSCEDRGLLNEYRKRASTVSEFETSVKGSGPINRAYAEFDFRTMLVMPWITNIAISMFIIVGGYFVLINDLSLGDFLASISIYKDAGKLSASCYKDLKEIYTVIGPFLRLVKMMNKATDAQEVTSQEEERACGMREQFAEMDAKGVAPAARGQSRFDLLQIRLVGVSLSQGSLRNISVSVPQGKMIAIGGAHATGKYSLLRLLRGSLIPLEGQVHVPAHLRSICVPRVPQLFHKGNLLENLTFGKDAKCNHAHLLQICKLVGLDKHSMNMVETQIREIEDPDVKDSNTKIYPEKGDFSYENHVPWYEQMSQSELLKMHMIRAFFNDPHMLLFQRPVDEMETDHAARFLLLIRTYVDQRGLDVSQAEIQTRRPRTVFFTTGEDRERSESARDVADIVWNVSKTEGLVVTDGGQNLANRDGVSRIVSSWSKQAVNLQRELDKEKHSHEHSKKHAETTEAASKQTQDTLIQLQREHQLAQETLIDVHSSLSQLEHAQAQQEDSDWLGCVGCVDRGSTKVHMHNAKAKIEESGLTPKSHEASRRSQTDDMIDANEFAPSGDVAHHRHHHRHA